MAGVKYAKFRGARRATNLQSGEVGRGVGRGGGL
jgi:hypothetical protein